MADDSSIKAEQARQVLANPIFNEAFDAVIDGIIESIASSSVEDVNIRNQLGLQLGAARGVKEAMLDYINTAKLDADEHQQRTGPEADD